MRVFLVSLEPIATATLAEIYVKQGLLDKALEVYQGILVQSPESESARKRIMQLQEMLGADVKPAAEDVQVPDEPLRDPSPVVSVVEDPVKSKSASLEEPPVTQEPKDASPLAVLQRWLSVIKNGRSNV